MMKHHGQCLCGKVKISTQQDISHINACHCGMCQKWSGAPNLSVDCKNDLTIEGKEFIKTYTSSDIGDRVFCGECGSHLYYYFKPKDQYLVSIGLFNDKSESKLELQIFIDCKPPYYNFAEKTAMLTEQDIINMFK